MKGKNGGIDIEEEGGKTCRGITLTAYNIYAAILADGLKEEIERKDILLPN